MVKEGKAEEVEGVESKLYKRKGSLFGSKKNDEGKNSDVVDLEVEEMSTAGRVKNLRNFYERQLREGPPMKGSELKGHRRRRRSDKERSLIFIKRQLPTDKKKSSKSKKTKADSGQPNSLAEVPEENDPPPQLLDTKEKKKGERKRRVVPRCSIL